MFGVLFLVTVVAVDDALAALAAVVAVAVLSSFSFHANIRTGLAAHSLRS